MVPVTFLVACAAGSSKPSASFCATARAIVAANSNAPILARQQEFERLLGQVDQLSAKAPASVRTALQTIAESVQPRPQGEAIGETARQAAADQKRQLAAIATVDNATRVGCAIDMSVFGQTAQSVQAPST
jgi:hypothetical protein